MLASRPQALRLIVALAAIVLPLVMSSAAVAQYEGRPVAQPYFDFPNWARWSNCRPHPLIWQFDPFVPYAQGDCQSCLDGSQGCPPPSNSCVENFVAHRPNGIYAIADFAPLTYDPNHNVEIARIGAAGATALSTGDIGYEFDAGARTTIGYTYSPCLRIEGTYFGSYSWDDTAAIRSAVGDLNTILSNFADAPGLDDNDLVSLGQFATFNSQEVNLRYWIDVPPGPFDVSLTLGARHVVARERLAFRSESTGTIANDLNVATDNDMWGGQIGFQIAWLQSSHVWLEFDAKGAMFNNNASQTSLYTNTDAGNVVTVFPTAREQQRTSWMGDIAAVYNIQFRPGLVLRLGYQAVFLNGIALSADNIQRDNTILRAGPAQLDDRGEVVYHGPVIGLMWNR
ncbi:hypothetical protein ETAA8_27510 [Anatilimnocola aggregata]|uniref:Uncharacterized protein n=1 Tax=Anatilimnocola aggregata TaxID=2528021 RepID=A0A517YC15_9BACT|nr:hypothetical protein [Anatilimnocola aggregata]QDU27662.1 hypothetical protein ETAA8_27510 [Anatilimnocola aggregata]